MSGDLTNEQNHKLHSPTMVSPSGLFMHITTPTVGLIYSKTQNPIISIDFQTFPYVYSFVVRDGIEWFVAHLNNSECIMVDLTTSKIYKTLLSDPFQWLRIVDSSSDGMLLCVEGIIPRCEPEYAFFSIQDPSDVHRLDVVPNEFLDVRGDIAWTDENECVYELWDLFCPRLKQWFRNLPPSEIQTCFDDEGNMTEPMDEIISKQRVLKFNGKSMELQISP